MNDYWFDQRYEAAFLDAHGHLSWTPDIDCSLCGPLDHDGEDNA